MRKLHAKRRELFQRLRLQIVRIGGENVWATLKDQNLRHRRIDMTKIVRHIKPRNVADRAGQLHTRRAAANNDKVQSRMRSSLHHLPLGQLKSEQNPAANLGRVLDSLQPGSKLRPVVPAKVRVRRARRENQVVVLQLARRSSDERVVRKIEPDRFIHQHIDIRMIAHQ